ncbi:MAG: hypothetical protein KDC00_02570 [Flavobacteriales bacterium]|nr:hypothetical protein [Flavobacteriales bacterium]
MSIRSIVLLPFSFLVHSVLAQVSEAPERVISSGKDEVTAIAVSPRGDRLLVGTEDGAVLLDPESGRKVHAFPFSEDGGTAVYHVAFNENGEFVVLIGHTGKRAVWNVSSGKQDKVLSGQRWIPDPRQVKAMGFDMANSTFDRFYQQTEVGVGDMTLRSAADGAVEFVDSEGKVQRTLTFPENKDQHHRAPLLLWGKYLLVGADDGKVHFYGVL